MSDYRIIGWGTSTVLVIAVLAILFYLFDPEREKASERRRAEQAELAIGEKIGEIGGDTVMRFHDGSNTCYVSYWGMACVTAAAKQEEMEHAGVGR